MTNARRPGRRSAAMVRGPILLSLFVAACTVGPNYSRPELDLPANLGVAQSPNPAPQRWWTLFNDPVLDQLVDEALEKNRDLRIAAHRIEQSRAQLGITRSEMFPDAGIEGSRSRTRNSAVGSVQLPPDVPLTTNAYRLVLRASWELDFWGKYRRGTEAARAELAASEAGREAVRASLIGDVARGYFTLRALDRRIEAVERTLLGRQKSLELQKLRLDAGVVSELEYRQVESDLRAAEALLPSLRQARTRQEGALAVLLGRSPREVFASSVPRGTPAAPATVEVPAGLPSDLLLRRPDLRQAEERLHAANARIGVARAAYFPNITLTGFFGGESQMLRDIFSPEARTWNVAGGLLAPLFAGGQIRGGLDLANARTREAAESYQQSVANAFREVRDALAAQVNARDAFLSQQAREAALARTLELSRLRYDNGAVSLFEVLETERQLILARLEAIDAERDRNSAVVDLYLALGA
ncbi:MAG TPA: efflux transporter outer membrane subunit [Usitatibacter sp.]|nr:efflux transporter outer membrane subunit [Usitatibacter sp.]